MRASTFSKYELTRAAPEYLDAGSEMSRVRTCSASASGRIKVRVA